MEKTDITIGIYITDRESALMLWENRNNTGNIANKKGWIINGFFILKFISFLLRFIIPI